jgi:hypothetical protein
METRTKVDGSVKLYYYMPTFVKDNHMTAYCEPRMKIRTIFPWILRLRAHYNEITR